MFGKRTRYLWQSTLFALTAAVLLAAAWGQTNDPKELAPASSAGMSRTRSHGCRHTCCSLTVDRSTYSSDSTRGVSCDGLAAQRSKGQFKPRLTEADRVRLDVAIEDVNEVYAWPGEARFDNRPVLDLAGEGALQNGGFSSFLASIFKGNLASFSSNGEVEVDGRKLAEFAFQVPRDESKYVFGTRRARVIVGYEGTFLADPATGDLVRLLVRPNPLPAETGACQATTTLDYNRVHLNDSDFLLPREANLDILNADGTELRNRTVLSSCHELRGEALTKLNEPPTEAAAAGKTPLPAGVAFKVLFTQPINTETASAGDRIDARLSSDIRDRATKAVLAPKGAEVTARIVRLLHFRTSPSSIRMLVKLETVNLGGNPVPFKATKNKASDIDATQTQRKVGVGVGTEATTIGASGTAQTAERRVETAPVGPVDPSVGLFEFQNTNANFVIKERTGVQLDHCRPVRRAPGRTHGPPGVPEKLISFIQWQAGAFFCAF